MSSPFLYISFTFDAEQMLCSTLTLFVVKNVIISLKLVAFFAVMCYTISISLR